jgi:protein O-mannosyl-transferase
MSQFPASRAAVSPPDEGFSLGGRRALTPRHLAAVALVALLALLPGVFTVSEFVYDDSWLIAENPRVHDLARFTDIWTTHWWEGSRAADSPLAERLDLLYRPLTMTTFALNVAVHGLQPAAFLLTNLLLHVAASLLVYAFVRRLLHEPVLALMTALIFAVHPVHVEAVSNSVGRAEIQMTIFALLGLLALLPPAGAPSLRRGGVALLAFTAAMFTKESAISYGPIALLVLLWRRPFERGDWRWWLGHAALLAVPVALYLPARYFALDGNLIRTTPPVYYMNPLIGLDGWAWLNGVLMVLGHYVRLMLVPAQLSANYGAELIDPAAGPTAMTAVGGLALLAAGVALSGWLRKSRPWRVVALLTTLTLASYLLLSQVFVEIGVTLAERFLYWPSVFVSALLAAGALAAYRRLSWSATTPASTVRLLRVVGVALLVALGVRSAIRSTDWSSNQVLFRVDARAYPADIHLNTLHADAQLRQAAELPPSPARDAILTEAERVLANVLERFPQHPAAIASRGWLELFRGDVEQARLLLARAAQLGSLNPNYRRMLQTLNEQHGLATTPAEAADAVAQDPDDPAQHVTLARVLLSTGSLARAEEVAAAALARWPNHRGLLDARARIALARNAPDAADHVRRLLVVDPDNWQMHTNLATVLAGVDAEDALVHARKAVALAPTSFEASVNLAEVLVHNDEYAEALRLYQALVAQLDPGDPLKPAVAERIKALRETRAAPGAR